MLKFEKPRHLGGSTPLNSTYNLKFVHIPKMGGKYISSYLCCHGSHFSLRQKSLIKQKNLLADNYFTSIREPISFYKSLFTFFKQLSLNLKDANGEKQSSGSAYIDVANSCQDINEFIKILFNKQKLSSLLSNSRKFGVGIQDGFYCNSINNYGLITNYISFYLSDTGQQFGNYEIKKGDEDDEIIEDRFKQIVNNKNLTIVKLEEFNVELPKLIKKFNITPNPDFDITKKVNKSKIPDNYNTIINEENIKLIKQKDILVYKYFYPELL